MQTGDSALIKLSFEASQARLKELEKKRSIPIQKSLPPNTIGEKLQKLSRLVKSDSIGLQLEKLKALLHK
jgi:hypothetical protein